MYLLYRKDSLAKAMTQLGIEDLHPWQEEAVTEVMKFQDALILAPTGGGKSLIFQLPAVMENGEYLTIVVSPMLALQLDQVKKLTNHGIKAVALNSELSASERKLVLDTLDTQQLLYVAPEQLQKGDFREALKKCVVSRVVVDEAHLIPEQQGDFRPAFSKIGGFIDSFADRPQVIACTATATPSEQEKIQNALGLDDPYVYQESVYRDNLRLSVKSAEDRQSLSNNRSM